MADVPSPSAAQPPAKPAILQSSEFTVEEGLAYRAMRTGAIWMNKLFFGSLILLVLWLAIATATDQATCTPSYDVADNGTADEPGQECSVFLTPTAKYLGAMAVLSFVLSLAFGALGLVVGKRVLEVAKSSEELGAGGSGKPGDDGRHGPGRP